MLRIITTIAAVLTFLMANAEIFSYRFNSTPLPKAIREIMADHPDLEISFIYNELENYKTSSTVHTDNAYSALHQLIDINPVTVTKSGDSYYIEALQHGKYIYTGKAVGTDNEPVVAATIMLLAPKDSTVLTYGITDGAGRFSIPCDRRGVLAKLSCVGYKTTYRKFDSFNAGTVLMTELPIELKTVTVEGEVALLLPDRSIYRPTQRQKNASQTATDLLVRMAIPQLKAQVGSSNISTAAGQSVAIYIDYIPASESDLKMMKVTDVKTVEYLEYPSDPRFQGNHFVINFSMIKYEYGGYAKALGVGNLIANSGSCQANIRFVKDKITYDLMGYGYYNANNHFGTDQVETFNLPQDNGETRSFQRESITERSKHRKQNYETSFRVLYSGDKVTANSQVALGLERAPHNEATGIVRYSNDLIGEGEYHSQTQQKAKYLNYVGHYLFNLPKSSFLIADLGYSYSHTDQSSSYIESKISPIYNAADDNTHKGNVGVAFNHPFSEKHSFKAHISGIYEHNRTDYRGSVTALDNSTTKFGQVGVSYSLSLTKFSSSFGIGWNWLSTSVNDAISHSNFPYADVSVQYVPNKSTSLGAVFHYSVWPPSSNFKSENIIHVSPFLWYTGNPFLNSHRSYDIGINFTFVPTNKFNMTVFTYSWLVGNRAAFVYDATPEGIIRTIRQPMGSFGHYNYGINLSTNQLDGSLYLSGQISQLYQPYNINHSYISYYLQALYYLGNFNFSLSYKSADATDNYDSMSGIWTKNKDVLIAQAGWSNGEWNIIVTAQNLQRWNWRASDETMRSQNYSVSRRISNASRHALVQISATYTFGFGKKVNSYNDISKQAGASSGILK